MRTKDEMACDYCGDTFYPRRKDQVTCGKRPCIAERNRQMERKRWLRGKRGEDDYSTAELDAMLAAKRTRFTLTEADIWARRHDEGWEPWYAKEASGNS